MHYPAPRINQALGIDPGASLDDALAAIAQLRAHVADAAALRAKADQLQAKLDETERDMARAYQGYQAGAERDAEDYQTLRREFNRSQDDNADLRATLANTDRFAERMQRERDTAYAVLHHLTAEFAP